MVTQKRCLNHPRLPARKKRKKRMSKLEIILNMRVHNVYRAQGTYNTIKPEARNKIFTIPLSVLSIPDFPIKLSSSLSIASGRRKKEEERRSGPRGHTTGAEAPFLSICRWLFVCLRWFPRYYGRRCHERANRDVKEKKEAPCFPLYISDNFFGIHMHEMVCFLRGKWRRLLLLFLNFFFLLGAACDVGKCISM